MQQLRVLRYRHQSHELQPPRFSVAQAIVLERRAHVLPLVRAGTCGELDHVAGAPGVQHAVVVAGLEGPPPLEVGVKVRPGDGIRGVERDGAILDVARLALPPKTPVGFEQEREIMATQTQNKWRETL